MKKEQQIHNYLLGLLSFMVSLTLGAEVSDFSNEENARIFIDTIPSYEMIPRACGNDNTPEVNKNLKSIFDVFNVSEDSTCGEKLKDRLQKSNMDSNLQLYKGKALNKVKFCKELFQSYGAKACEDRRAELKKTSSVGSENFKYSVNSKKLLKERINKLMSAAVRVGKAQKVLNRPDLRDRIEALPNGKSGLKCSVDHLYDIFSPKRKCNGKVLSKDVQKFLKEGRKNILSKLGDPRGEKKRKEEGRKTDVLYDSMRDKSIDYIGLGQRIAVSMLEKHKGVDNETLKKELSKDVFALVDAEMREKGVNIDDPEIANAYIKLKHSIAWRARFFYVAENGLGKKNKEYERIFSNYLKENGGELLGSRIALSDNKQEQRKISKILMEKFKNLSRTGNLEDRYTNLMGVRLEEGMVSIKACNKIRNDIDLMCNGGSKGPALNMDTAVNKVETPSTNIKEKYLSCFMILKEQKSMNSSKCETLYRGYFGSEWKKKISKIESSYPGGCGGSLYTPDGKVVSNKVEDVPDIRMTKKFISKLKQIEKKEKACLKNNNCESYLSKGIKRLGKDFDLDSKSLNDLASSPSLMKTYAGQGLNPKINSITGISSSKAEQSSEKSIATTTSNPINNTTGAGQATGPIFSNSTASQKQNAATVSDSLSTINNAVSNPEISKLLDESVARERELKELQAKQAKRLADFRAGNITKEKSEEGESEETEAIKDAQNQLEKVNAKLNDKLIEQESFNEKAATDDNRARPAVVRSPATVIRNTGVTKSTGGEGAQVSTGSALSSSGGGSSLTNNSRQGSNYENSSVGKDTELSLEVSTPGKWITEIEAKNYPTILESELTNADALKEAIKGSPYGRVKIKKNGIYQVAEIARDGSVKYWPIKDIGRVVREKAAQKLTIARKRVRRYRVRELDAALDAAGRR